ncbi:hypothetical protein MA16_Dca000092 [Dendrobium catenatum]|uniref:Reverse transcriptase domain-containing protein n=1 Tax=Dendrobium catenatum TaxID=906689 RepID=A0A2I0WSV8_9ASPA|nr:hypothetical protein MA16_Dca000092 [Dendrobium catenatum]
MPLSIFKRLDIGEVQPTSFTLELVDKSFTYPRGVTEDMLIKVNKFIFPVDFIVLNIEEDKEIHLILGSSFLATRKAMINA